MTDWGERLEDKGELILIGSAGLLLHVHLLGRNDPLPENSMDADPITHDEEVARLAYDCLIGSEFERKNGWHVNLMPDVALSHLPEGWETRSVEVLFGKLTVQLPSAADLLAPKLNRGEPRDLAHREFAVRVGLIDE